MVKLRSPDRSRRFNIVLPNGEKHQLCKLVKYREEFEEFVFEFKNQQGWQLPPLKLSDVREVSRDGGEAVLSWDQRIRSLNEVKISPVVVQAMVRDLSFE